MEWRVNVLFNNPLNTFLYGVIHMLKDHSDSKKGNLLLPLHGLLFPISSKVSFMERRGNVLFNDTLNTFIYGYMASEIW